MGSIVSGAENWLDPNNLMHSGNNPAQNMADPFDLFGSSQMVRNLEDPLNLFGLKTQGTTDSYNNFVNSMISEAQPLLKDAGSGTLTPGQQAAVKAFTQQQTTQGEMASAKAGLGRSTTEVELKNQAIQAGQEYANQFITQDFQEGLSLLGAASGNISQLAQLTMAQNEMMGQVLGNAGSAIGNIVGSGGGGLAPTDVSSPSFDVTTAQPITIPDYQPVQSAPVFSGG